MRSAAPLLLLAALAAPASGDTVHLVNGKKFEQVEAEEGDGEVRIRMPHGEIVLPERLVAGVERSRSVWRIFGERRQALATASAPAREWLELALWADRTGYPEGMREALLRAGAQEPALEGLAPLMARIGYIFDREEGTWLAEGDYMRRRGFRRWGDQWLPQDEFAGRVRAREAAQRRRREDAREERIARAIEALAVAQLSRAAEPEPEPEESRGPLVAVFSGGFFAHGPPLAGVPARVAAPPAVTYDDLVTRQPGSLFPVEPRRHLTSSE